jgi:hypothetical protein
VFTSGSVWVAAGVVSLLASSTSGILTLVFGGALIFPISIIFCKLLGRTGKHHRNNPLGPLAIEGTIWMLLSIPIAGAASFYRPEWFFPEMMLVIAGRYLTFSTIYGLRSYWVFGVTLALSSYLLIVIEAPSFVGAFTGGVVEYAFAIILFFYSEKS